MKDLLLPTKMVLGQLCSMGASPTITYNLFSENVIICMRSERHHSTPYYVFNTIFQLQKDRLIKAYRLREDAVHNYDFVADKEFFEAFLEKHLETIMSHLEVFNQVADDYEQIAALLHIPRMLPVARKFGL
jgi:hypothetical protein